MYEPNDSPFGDFVRHVERDGATAVECYGQEDLWGFAAVASSLLNRPVHAGDQQLERIRFLAEFAA